MKGFLISAVLALVPTAHAQQVSVTGRPFSEVLPDHASDRTFLSVTCRESCVDITTAPPSRYSAFDLSMADRIGIKLSDKWTMYAINRRALGVTQSRQTKSAANKFSLGQDYGPLVRGKTQALEFVYEWSDSISLGFRPEYTKYSLTWMGAESVKDYTFIAELRVRF
jgi:hypothetical protein